MDGFYLYDGDGEREGCWRDAHEDGGGGQGFECDVEERRGHFGGNFLENRRRDEEAFGVGYVFSRTRVDGNGPAG